MTREFLPDFPASLDSAGKLVGWFVMLLAGAFAAVLFIVLIVGDWLYFVRLTADASRYGCGIARALDQVWCADFDRVIHRFDQNGLLVLPHGTARFFPDVKRILFRPTYRLFALGFRTAWPLKGSLELAPADNGYRVIYTKRIPWSSAIITSLWFALVGLGTISFLVGYAAQGGFSSLSGVLLGAGVLALGLLVLAFGLVTITMAYRLEDSRLTQVYQELRAALDWSNSPAYSPPV
ncbi:MAG TPA: hypothetical protein VHF07_00360 [Nitrospiraceae bacterium]|nr:hypothetical protein [Nitrospiraceae bacterium]